MREKLLTALIAATMVLSLCACGKEVIITEKNPDTTQLPKPDVTPQTQLPTPDVTSQTQLPTPDASPDKDVKITRNEAATIEYEDYSNGYVNMKIPKGWTVEIYNPQLITYMIRVYNPQNPNYNFGYQLYYDAILKSEEARTVLRNYYGDMYNQYIVCNPKNSSGFFDDVILLNNWGTDFNVVQELGTNALGGQVIQGSFTGVNGEACEGIFTTTILDLGVYNISENMMDIYSKQVDVMPMMASGSTLLYAPQTDFINWQPIMNYCLSTISYTQQFEQDRQAAWNQVMQTSYQISQTYNQISDMIMDSWEKRNTSFDIISQKNSDSILGKERIYDTETNEVYIADVGWSDKYSGNRYKLVTEDSYYLMPTSGWLD